MADSSQVKRPKRSTGRFGTLLQDLESYLAVVRAEAPAGPLRDQGIDMLQQLQEFLRPPKRKGLFWWGGRWRKHDWGRIVLHLGKQPDSYLAREIGTDRGTVRAMRTRMGIATFDPLKAMEPMLGKVSDREIARRLGLDKDAVARRRNRLGIGPYRKRGARNAEAKELAKLLEGIERVKRYTRGV